MKTHLIIILAFLSLNIHAQHFLPFGLAKDSLNYGNGVASIPEIHNFFADGDTLYVGGRYFFGDSDTLMHIGKWYDETWHTMGFGIIDGSGVRRTLKYKNHIYTGGLIRGCASSNVITTTFPERIPGTASLGRWNPTEVSWEALPNSYGELYMTNLWDMIVFNDTLIIAADPPSNTPWYSANRITAYDADINDYIDIGKLPGYVYALEVFNNELYAGGQWSSLKKFVGGTGYEAWEDVGGHTNYYIQDMDVDTFNNFLYVAGGFNAVDDTILTDNVAIWNGYYWEKVGYGNSTISQVYDVKFYNGYLYAGIGGWSIGGVETGALAYWDGQDWDTVGNKYVNGVVYDLEVWQNKLYIGGKFDTIGGQAIYHKSLAIWEDTTPNCRHLKPRIFTDNMQDTFDIVNGSIEVQFYNNNAYVDAWSWDFGDTGTDNVKDPVHTYSDIGTYNVAVTITHGTCTQSFNKDIVIVNSQSIEELQKETGFKIYPNPTKGNLQLVINNEQLLNKNIEILDVNGKTIKQFAIANKVKQSLDISILSKGIYFVKIGKQTERFVKE